MKKILALSIAAVMTAGIASSAFADANPLIQLALDMQAKSKTRSCATMATTYSSCSAINNAVTVASGVGTLDVIAVVYNFTGITAVEFGIDWGSTSTAYSPIFTKCSDLDVTISGALVPHMETQLAWGSCKTSAGGTSGIAAGYVRLTVTPGGIPGAFNVTPSQSGSLGTVDCQFLDDEIHTIHNGAINGAPVTGLVPCTLGPTATEHTTWSGVKSLYR